MSIDRKNDGTGGNLWHENSTEAKVIANNLNYWKRKIKEIEKAVDRNVSKKVFELVNKLAHF